MIGIGIAPISIQFVPVTAGSAAPENALLLDGKPLTLNGNYLVLGELVPMNALTIEGMPLVLGGNYLVLGE